MAKPDPVDVLFGGMEKLGPGSNADTLHVLHMLPRREFRLVVDAGCGTGRQTFVLARELGVRIHALDSHQPFLDELVRRAPEAGIAHLMEVHCMDMKDIARCYQGLDLLWSEGAAYNIGFGNALVGWSSALSSNGLLVVSELSWLKERAPDEAKAFFESAYPDMRSVHDNVAVAKSAGYRVLTTHTVSPQAWVDGYYDVLASRASNLLDHPDAEVRAFAAETVREIEVFHRSEESYGYVFYVLEAA